MSHALATPLFATTKAASNHQCIRFPKEVLKHFHALKGLPNSSSWFDQVVNTSQNHKSVMKSWATSKISKNCLGHCVFPGGHPSKY